MPSKHSIPPRGLEAAGHNPGLRGAKFGRLFPELPAGVYGPPGAQDDNLKALAAAMVSPFDGPKDAPDDEESGIPALYTYFGQFIDHDLTFDPNGSFAKQKDENAAVDFRTPAFDLDNLYGRGPGDQPYLYEEDSKTLRVGDPLTLGVPSGATDLQRNGAGRALIGDPRNDENAIVSQFQGLMTRFHNSLVKKHRGKAFEEIQKLMCHHYQYVVVNDFLTRIVTPSVLADLKGTDGHYHKDKLKFFTNFQPFLPYMPLEFSVAAYRLGHSMIRPGYRLNDATLLPIFPLPPESQPGFPEGLTGFRRMVSDWGIDWGRFIDLDERAYGDPNPAPSPTPTPENFKRLQFAYRIDTALVDPLATLPPSVATGTVSLAARNLLRGGEFGLPTGQEVATKMGVTPLTDEEILIGQAVDDPAGPLPNITSIAGGVFAGNCPLWTYVLAEAMRFKATGPVPATGAPQISTPQLGPVGGRIVAEVFLGLMFADKGSYLHSNPAWTPPEGQSYRLKDLVAAALAP